MRTPGEGKGGFDRIHRINRISGRRGFSSYGLHVGYSLVNCAARDWSEVIEREAVEVTEFRAAEMA